VHIALIGEDKGWVGKVTAEITSGTYTVIPDYSVHHMDNILALLCALSVRITLQADEGITISSVTPGRYGNLVSSNKQSATVYLHNIYAGQQKSCVVYLTVPQGKEKLLTIGGKYLCRDKLVTVDVAVLRPRRRKCLPDEVVIHPKVVSELLRIRLMEGIAKGDKSSLRPLLDEINDSDEGRAAPDEVLSDIKDEFTKIFDRYNYVRSMLASLCCNQLQRSTTEGRSTNIHAFQIVDQQRADEHTNMVSVCAFLFQNTCPLVSMHVFIFVE
jgi:hypothetical protein